LRRIVAVSALVGATSGRLGRLGDFLSKSLTLAAANFSSIAGRQATDRTLQMELCGFAAQRHIQKGA
jgi:hypothetical protein